MIYEVYGAKNNVIVDMPLVNMRRQNVFVLTLCYRVGKLTPDFVGFLIFHFSRRKRLYQMVGEIIAFFHSLRQGKSELNICRFIGTAERGHKDFFVRLCGVLDIVKCLA